MMMDGTLFNIEDYTDKRVRRIMQGNTCRHCGHRIPVNQGLDQHVRVFVCDARPSGRTKSKLLRVRADQPACILFTHKDNSK